MRGKESCAMGALPEKVVELNENKAEKNNVVTLPNVKLRKDGLPKRTKSNAKEGESSRVYPIKNKEDIEKIKKYFRDQIDSKWYPDDKYAAGRNLCLFRLGINIGLRMSDIVKLKWKDVLYADGTFKDAITVQEKKTKKYKEFFLNDNAREALRDFIIEFNIETKPEAYIFKSRIGGHIEVRSVNQIIKDAGKAVGIKYNLGTHSLRKTWSYWQLITHQNDAYFMATLMDLMNHSSEAVTLRYAGLSSDKNRQYYNDVNL